MSIAFRLDGALLPYQTVRLTGSNPTAPGGVQGLPSSAWYGEPMTAGVVIEDPNGSLDIVGWHTFTVEETACSKPRIFTGWITGKAISRGSYRTGAGRIWNCDIIDQNALFSFEVFRAQSAQRPAETDIARVAFAQASAPMAFTPAADNGRLNTTDNPVNFGDANYVGQYPVELFMSVAGTSGKNFYAYWDDSADEISLHYDLVDANPASTLRISNVAADIDSTTTFGPFIDAELSRTPEDIYTGILFQYKGAYAYGRSQTTIDAFSPTEFSPIEWHRDLVYSTDRVGKLETANALVQSMLEVKSDEQDTINVTVQLPASKVNLIHAGDKVDVKFSHLPGYEDFVGMAVIRRNVVPTDNHDSLYDVHLELSNASAPRGPGGGDPGEFPPTVECDVDTVTLEQEVYDDPTNPDTGIYQAAWDTQPTPGNLLIASWLGNINGTTVVHDMAGWNYQGQAHVVATGGQAKWVSLFTKIASSSEDMNPTVELDFASEALHCWLQEWSGVDTVDTVVIEEDEDGSLGQIFATITPTSGLDFALIVGSFGVSGNVSNLGTMPSGIPTLDNELHTAANQTFNIVHRIVETTSGSYTIGTDRTTGAKGAGLAVALSCSGSAPDAPCLAPGQPSGIETVILTGADGTTRCPFADGTLHVYIDNVEQTAKLAAQDGAAGTFTLGFTPTPTEVCTVTYLGR